MPARVPLAHRNLLAEQRRVGVSLLGIGACIALILLLQGLWSGTRAQISAYADNSPAELFVGSEGTKNLATDRSSLSEDLVGEIETIDGVKQAAPIASRFVILDLHGTKVPLTVVGSVPDQIGGPWSLSEGRTVQGAGQVAVDEITAEEHNLRIGDELSFMGHELTVVGLLSDSRSWMTGMAFVSLDELQMLQRTPREASFILVDTQQPSAVADAIKDRFQVDVLTRAQLAANERKLYGDIIEAPLLLMIGIAFAAGTMIIALTTYSSLVERLREFGIAKAIGARPRDLLRTILGETTLLALSGTVVGLLMFLGGSRLLQQVKPQFWTRLTAGTVIAVLGSAVAMALLAAYIPTRRIARVEPASVYRG